MKDYSILPLTIEALEDNTVINFSQAGLFFNKFDDIKVFQKIQIIKNSLYYKINKENKEHKFKGKIILKKRGDTLSIFNKVNYLNTIDIKFRFFSNKKVNLYGNILSLLNWDKKLSNYCFYQLFNGLPVINCSNLILPKENLKNHCYDSLFYCCTLLKNIPNLKNIYLTNDSCSYMFSDCYSLTKTVNFNFKRINPENNNKIFENCFSLKYLKQFKFDKGYKVSNFCILDKVQTKFSNYKIIAKNYIAI